TNFTMEGRSPFTWTSAGQTWTNGLAISMVGGTLTLQDSLISSDTSQSINLTNGTFNANNFNVTTANMRINGSLTRTLTMGSGTWTITGNGSNYWNAGTVTNLTFNPNTSTIVLSNTTTASKTFTGGGLTYNNVTFSGDNITVTGNNTFNTIALNNAGLGIGLRLTAGTTQNVNNFTSNGSVGSLTAASSTSASVATIHKFGGGTICLDYVNIDYIVGSPANTWYMGANSTDGGHNTQLIFTGCPGAPTPNTGARTTSGPANEKVWGGFKIRGGVKFR
ncbi:MAG: hypothetical protein AAB837_00005, partial [Patescibacteria group bacterium]